MFDEFLNAYYHNDVPPDNSFTKYYATLLRDNHREMFEKNDKRNARPLISASNLGDPLAVLILKKLGYKPSATLPLSPVDRNFLYTGFEVEVRLLAQLMSFGLNVYGEQQEVEYRGYKGHIDALLDGYVIDVKAVKSATFTRMFGKKPYVSERYKSQLAFYRAGLGLSHAGLLVYNRDTADIGFVDLSNDTEAKTELDRKIDVLESCCSLEYLWENEDTLIPEARPEIYKGAETGNYLLPDEMRFSEYATVFYHMGTGVNSYGVTKPYVTGYKTFEEAKETLSSWHKS